MMTIIEAIKEVLKDNKNGLTSKEIYDLILERGLYTFNAQNPVHIVNGTIRKHCYGLDFPSASVNKHFSIIEKERGRCRYIVYSQKESVEIIQTNIISNNKDLLPEENLKKYYDEHISLLKVQLKDTIMNSSPQLFEKMVVELLLKMGYGYDGKSGSVTNYSHDGGVDGIIKEDNLGLDKIYIQAKRYNAEKTVSTADVYSFLGVMLEAGVNKGVFITTSKFAKTAENVFSKTKDKRVIKLIDGEELMDYLIKYEVGIENVKNYKTYQIKESYFL